MKLLSLKRIPIP